MRWRRLFLFERGGSLVALCAIVIAWEVSAMALLGTMALYFEDFPFLIYMASALALVLPVFYAAIAVIAYAIRR
jgi:hypothetical protein